MRATQSNFSHAFTITNETNHRTLPFICTAASLIATYKYNRPVAFYSKMERLHRYSALIHANQNWKRFMTSNWQVRFMNNTKRNWKEREGCTTQKEVRIISMSLASHLSWHLSIWTLLSLCYFSVCRLRQHLQESNSYCSIALPPLMDIGAEVCHNDACSWFNEGWTNLPRHC